jgi:ubiquitin C-terminal hydrolase
MESNEQKLKQQLTELKEGVKQIRKDAELMNLAHITTELKLRSAVDLLIEAQAQMNAYRPDLMVDEDYDGVLARIDTFLTEIEKSNNNG